MNAVLLDTHTFLWLVDDNSRLSSAALSELRLPMNGLLLSYGSVWEMAIKIASGKLVLSLPLEGYLTKHLQELGIDALPIALESVLLVGKLPRHHGDPFDRMLVAQSLSLNIPIISHDAKLDAYGVKRIW